MTFEEFEALLDEALDFYNSIHSGGQIDAGVTGGLNAVRYDIDQNLAEMQKAQARRNIGAGEGTGGVIASATEPTDLTVRVWINTSGSAPVLYIRNTEGVWYPVPGLEGPAGPATGVNPNLLDNWYLGNPVNQRGQTSYSGNTYTIDRWKSFHSTATVTVQSNGVEVVDPTAGYITFTQKIENPEQFAEKTLTFSVLANSISGTWRLMVRWGDDTAKRSFLDITSSGLHSLTVTLPDSGLDFLEVGINPRTASAPINILACKLELGDTQTLAHQDSGGNWVLNEIPDYGEQLARCQRFCQTYVIRSTAVTPLAVGYIYGTNFTGQFPIPVSMRTNPSIATSGTAKFQVTAAGQTYALGTTLPTVYGIKNDQILLRTAVAEVNTQTAAVLAVYGEADNVSRLIFSADL